MGLLFSLPLAGVMGTVASSCLAGLAFFCTSTAASMFCKSCNCNSSIATRVGFAIIFCLNSLLAWVMKTPFALRQIEKLTYDYIKLDCSSGGCYGVLAVHRICFALALFHAIIGASLIGVQDTRSKRAAIQNGWWGPKVLLWLVLVVVAFVIPNPFFIFWGNYISLVGATIFILLGLVLLVDFAHSWSETCLEKWEAAESNLWQYILIGSTAAAYIGAITLTGIMYAFFASDGCTLNRFFISFNLALCIIITIICIHPAVQDANPRSGLAQSSVVALYCTYLIMSAVGNATGSGCKNPLHERASAARTTTVVFGAIFTFLAIAYSTSRAATQSRALVGRRDRSGAIQLPTNDTASDGGVTLVTSQPSRTETPRYQALLAAVEAGAIPASALDEEQDEDDDEGGITGEERDDERTGTRYNYTWFHVIFMMGAMYVAMLLTEWQVLRSSDGVPGKEPDFYIGRSKPAMWMRIVSSWVCMLLYIWSLVAPVLMPDRFGE
ncbi:TMS membrane protein/tumor differentially expressed protein [Ramaria rubella]|nr:TMS membrane protein/tumor differentially expressed protein [Ramaria rubella]KAF8575173.1 TMS membrane protein/tumor differentially expressed protein [Ramaria rubella]